LNSDIEQLGKINVTTPAMNVEVTSVRKQESTVGRSPAAVYVITQEMIHRSACNNIPDLLRLVPGMEVARVDAHTWAISLRGLTDRYSNMLLVLVDGRSVYSPLVGTVYWDVQDMLLEDIDRIEVIRGPGGTLWGDNAFNGVVNIITKKAKDTQGSLVTYGGGTENLGLGGARYGGTFGEDLHYRIYGKQFENAAGFSPTGPGYDDWRQGRAGFRADWEPDRAKADLMTVQGDYYVGAEGMAQQVPLPISPYSETYIGDQLPTGSNLLARWTHTFDEKADWSLQTYYDRIQSAWAFQKYSTTTFDVEFQNRFPLADRHAIIWGSDYRQVRNEMQVDGFYTGFIPPQRTTGLFSMFVQDEIEIVEDRFYFTVGTKLERNDFSGFEYQPSGRVLYTPDQKHSFWAAISRAVRTPSYFEQNGYLTNPPTQNPEPPPDQYFQRIQGNTNFISEDLIAYEIGYRAQPQKEFSYDIAIFYNAYENLQAFQMGYPYEDQGNAVLPLYVVNAMRGQTYGAEISGTWAVSERWRLSGSYSNLQIQLYPSADAMAESVARAGYSPHNQVRLMSSWDIGEHWKFDMIGRYVDNLQTMMVPEYITMDLQLAWAPNKHLEFAAIGRNLLDNHHYEFNSVFYPYNVTEIERSVFGKVTWRF
jgi:iron complex outermembrane receptor protein